MKTSWMKSTSRRAALMNQSGCRRGTTHTRVASSAGSNWPINCQNIKKVGRKGDVMFNPLDCLEGRPAALGQSRHTQQRVTHAGMGSLAASAFHLRYNSY